MNASWRPFAKEQPQMGVPSHLMSVAFFLPMGV